MFPEINKKTLKKVFLVVAAGIVLYWLLNNEVRVKSVFDVLKSIFNPFILGAAMAFVLNVPMRAIEKWFKFIKQAKFRRVVAMVLTLVAFLLIVGAVSVLLIFAVIDAYGALESKLRDYEFLNRFFTQLQPILAIDLEELDLRNFGFREIVSLAEQLIETLGSSISAIVTGAFSTVGKIGGAVVNFVIAIVFALYCLGQKETLARQGRKLLYAFCPEKFADETVRILRLSNATFSNFLSGQCIEVCILGCMFAITMAIFRMPFIALISILIAVTAFIPIVGAFAGCIIGAFLILMRNPDNPMQAVLFVVMFLVLQQIEGNLIYPRVVGNSVGLSGMWVLLAVAVGGKLFGVVGMFMMIPVASVFYTILQEKTHKRLEKKLEDKNFDPEKLKVQPPELRPRRKNKQECKKKNDSPNKQDNVQDKPKSSN